MKTHSASRRLSAGLTLATALVLFASCTVDTSGLTFIPDDEFNQGASGGSSSTTGGDGAGGDGNTVGGDGAGGSGEACTPGEIDCDSDGVLRECMDGDPPAFEEVEDCGEPGRCSVSRNTCLACAPGAFRCSGVTLEQCDMMGEVWEPVQDCVDEPACTASGQTGYCKICDPGASVCEASLAALNGEESEGTPPNSQIYTCSANGAFTELAADCQGSQPFCNVAQQDCGECFPGTVECRGADLRSCSVDGNWNYDDFCDSPAACNALAGECDNSGIECVTGQMQCVDNIDFATLQTCSPQGMWQNEASCANIDLCSTNWYAPGCEECDPSTFTQQCVNGAIMRCDYQPGTSKPILWQVEQCANDCTGQTSCDFNSCVPGAVQCDYSGANYYYLCQDGTNREYHPCASGEFCIPGFDGCVSCFPGGYSCDNGQLYRCATDGQSTMLIENCELTGRQCNPDAGKCVAGNLGGYFCNDNGDFMYNHVDGTEVLIESCGAGRCNSSWGCDQSSTTCTDGALACQGREVRVCNNGFYEDSGVLCSSATVCQPEIGCTVPTQLGAGYAHSCAILAEEGSPDGIGYAVCWGANEHGQLGNGSDNLGDVLTPRRVLLQFPGDGGGEIGGLVVDKFAIAAFTRVCGGRDFSCAGLQNPSAPGQDFVGCWGSNEFGQLGLDNPDPGPFNAIQFPFFVSEAYPGSGDPVPLDLDGVVCGEQFACALDGTGQAYCWGRNDAGQLGADVTDEYSPFALEVSGGHAFVELAAGAKHACGVEGDGAVWCWGDGSWGQLGADTGGENSFVPVQVGELEVSGSGDAFPIAGRDFSAVRSADENPLSWGANLFGQLADGSTDGRGVPGAMTIESDNVLGLFAGSLSQHFCARGPEGRLSCAGANVFGQLGDGTTVDRTELVEVWDGSDPATTLADLRAAVAVGGRHTCAINAKNEVWCWGANHRHQLGSNKSTPQDSPQKVF